MASLPNSSARPPGRSPEAGRAGILARAALAQAAGAALALALGLQPLAPAAAAAAAAAGLALRLPPWWPPLLLALPLAAWGALALPVAPAWYLAAAAALWLVFGLTARTTVPLYLSSARELEALASLVPEDARVLDAGCGPGTALAALAAARPGASLEGVEAAALPWLAARLRARGRWRARLGSLWRADFGRHDVVYAYLSPAAMPRLWAKARAEMRPGTLLVSNRFAVAGVPPARALDTGGARRLYCWRM